MENINKLSSVTSASALQGTDVSANQKGNLSARKVVNMPRKGNSNGAGCCFGTMAVFLTIALIGASLLIRYAVQRAEIVTMGMDGRFGVTTVLIHNPSLKIAGAALLGIGGGMSIVTGGCGCLIASKR